MGEITPGLVSHDSVLCSEVAVVIVVATLGGIGSNSSSSSSSRIGDSWISEKEIFYLRPAILFKHCYKIMNARKTETHY